MKERKRKCSKRKMLNQLLLKIFHAHQIYHHHRLKWQGLVVVVELWSCVQQQDLSGVKMSRTVHSSVQVPLQTIINFATLKLNFLALVTLSPLQQTVKREGLSKQRCHYTVLHRVQAFFCFLPFWPTLLTLPLVLSLSPFAFHGNAIEKGQAN